MQQKWITRILVFLSTIFLSFQQSVFTPHQAQAAKLPVNLKPAFEELKSIDSRYISSELTMYFDFTDGEPALSFMLFGYDNGFYDFQTKQKTATPHIIKFPTYFDHSDWHILNLGHGDRFYLFYPDNNEPIVNIYDRTQNTFESIDGYFIAHEDVDQDGQKEICVYDNSNKENNIAAYGVKEGAGGKLVIKKMASGKVNFSVSTHFGKGKYSYYKVIYDEQLATLFAAPLDRKQTSNKINQDFPLTVTGWIGRGGKRDNFTVNSLESTQNRFLINVPLIRDDDGLTISPKIRSRLERLYYKDESYTGSNRRDCHGCKVSPEIGFYENYFAKSSVFFPVEKLGKSRVQGVSLTEKEYMVLNPDSLDCTTALIDQNLYCGQSSRFEAGTYKLENGVTLNFGFPFNMIDNHNIDYALNVTRGVHGSVPFSLAMDKSKVVLFSGNMEFVSVAKRESEKERLKFPEMGYRALSQMGIYEIDTLLPFTPHGLTIFFNYIFALDEDYKLFVYKPVLKESSESSKTKVEQW